jgi:hypothetical protein
LASPLKSDTKSLSDGYIAVKITLGPTLRLEPMVPAAWYSRECCTIFLVKGVFKFGGWRPKGCRPFAFLARARIRSKEFNDEITTHSRTRSSNLHCLWHARKTA